MKRWLWIAGLMLLLLTISTPVGAETALPAETAQPTEMPSDDAVNAIARQLYCPVCENTPLDVCPTQACAQWRELIRLKLAEGWTETQIKDYFVAQYGDRVLSEPPLRGLHWLVYILPPVFFLIGVIIVVRVLRRMRKPAAAVAVSPTPEAATAPQRTTLPQPDDPYLAQMEEALRKRQKE